MPRPFLLVVVSLFLAGCVHRAVRVPSEALAEPPPEGKVAVTVTADADGSTWLMKDGTGVCDLPCARTLDPHEGFRVQSSAGEVVEVQSVAAHLPGARRAMVVAEGVNEGERVNGIVFTTLGGMGDVVAITLTAVGCSDTAKRGGMCAAGLITAAVTVPLTIVSIWMIVDSAPKAHVLPVIEVPTGKNGTPVSMTLTPTGVFGRF